MTAPRDPIYHLAPEPELRDGLSARDYAPAGLAVEGFVHCAGSAEVAVAVARDYFAERRDLLYVLEIDPGRLQSELRFEAPAPIEGGGIEHLSRADRFPHVYGPIARDAITGVAPLARTPDGYRWPESWPETFEPLSAIVNA